MRKSILPLLALACAGAHSAGAATVNVSAAQNVGISFQGDAAAANNNTAIRSDATLRDAVATGDDLLIGNYVLIGNFKISDLEIQQHATDLGYLLDPNRFTRFGSADDQPQIGDGFGINGHFSSSVSANADPLGLAGKQIYLFVLGSTNTSSYASAVSTAFQIGIFYYDSTTTTDTFLSNNWKFKADTGVPSSSTIDFADLTTNGAGSSRAAAARTVLGDFGGDTSDFTNATNFRLQAIPEPGSAALALLGGAALILRRRRR